MAIQTVGKSHRFDSMREDRIFATLLTDTPDNDDVKLYTSMATEIKTRIASLARRNGELDMPESSLPADLVIMAEKFYESWLGYNGPKPLSNAQDILWVVNKIGQGVMNGQVIVDNSPRNLPKWNLWKELSHPLISSLESLNMKDESRIPNDLMESLKSFYSEWGLSTSEIPTNPADAHEAVIEIGLQVQIGNLPNVEWETRLVTEGTMQVREQIMQQAQQLAGLLERFVNNAEITPSRHLTLQLEAFYKACSWPIEDRPLEVTNQVYALRSIARQIQKSIKSEKEARAHRKAERSANRPQEYSVA